MIRRLAPLALLSLAARPAHAGAVSANHEVVETGDLRVEGANVETEAWLVDVSSYGPELSLKLRLKATSEAVAVSLTTKTSNDGVEAEIPVFAKVTIGPDVRSIASTPSRKVVEKDTIHRTRFELYSVKNGAEIELELTWSVPDGGPGDKWDFPALRKTYCLDAATEKAFRGFDGATSVRLKFSAPSKTASLAIVRSEPISLCGKGIRRVDEKSFVVEDVKTLPAVVPILVARRI